MVAYPARAFHSPASISVIRSRPAPSVNTHCVRTQCDLGTEQSKFTTELMAEEWECDLIPASFPVNVEGLMGKGGSGNLHLDSVCSWPAMFWCRPRLVALVSHSLGEG